MKTLIAYFSRGGTTARAAAQLEKIVDGDLFEIRGNKNYGNYFQALGIARKEFSSNELPEVESDIADFESYDRILLGFPIWYSKAPQLVISFLSCHDLKGKDIYPFCTSGMSGPEEAVRQLTDAFPDARIHPGIRLNKVDQKAVQAWLGS